MTDSPVLEAVKVSKHFGGLKAVDDVSMKIYKGDIFGIIGPNGAGKTTFFNMCTGIYPVTDGRILFNGQDITKTTPDKVARMGMARTFQNLQLFKFMTVLDNVKIGCHTVTKSSIFDAVLHTKRYHSDEKYAVERSHEVLEDIGLSEYSDTMAGNLPYGMQRKVEIARALALKPEILLLDEPAAGMNPNETKSLAEFILMLHEKGYTITVIEHDMKFIMGTCNRILVLNFGRLLSEGSPEQIQKDPKVQEAYFGKGIIGKEAVK